MDVAFELGLYTFGDLMPEAQAGKMAGAQQRLSEILAAAKPMFSRSANIIGWIWRSPPRPSYWRRSRR
jgi:hypothetical protein